MITNEEIAKRFEQLAALMEIRGENEYRIRSYRNAADMIRSWPTSLVVIASEEGVKGLRTIAGVGVAISGKIMELVERGTFESWEKTIAETPFTVLDLLKVEGVGMKTAAILHRQFKISSLDDFAKFVEGGGLEMVDGIGEKSAERIKESLNQTMRAER